MEHESQTQKQSGKQYMIIAAIALVILIGLGAVMFKNSKSPAQKQPAKQLDASEAIPTVDASVKVDLEGVQGNKEVVISVSGIPNGTQQIEYEMSYNTKEDVPQGLYGKIDMSEEKSKDSVERKVTLGTCSSGTCKYHNVTGPIKASLKFSGSYGERLFEKNFTL